jgi:translation initiation factor IF-1
VADREDDRRYAGTVVDLLPNALYRVRLEGDHRVLAHAAGGIRKNFVRLVEGDRVLVELEPRDQGRGRIVRKL